MINYIAVLNRKNSDNLFNQYLFEILASEGINGYDVIDFEQETSSMAWEKYPLVLLPHIELNDTEVKQINDYVKNGGQLIALRPDRKLDQLFGLKSVDQRTQRIAEKYVSFEKDAFKVLGKDLELQFHGCGDLYTVEGSDVLAYYAGQLGYRSPYPAIFKNNYGKGTVWGFSFDLARSTLLFHQGRKEQASNGPCPDIDADSCFKANDLFTYYLDERLKNIPQADLYQDVFVAMIKEALSGRHFVRVWHYPDASPALALLDGDSDFMSERQGEEFFEIAESYGVKYSLYVMEDDFKAMPKERMKYWLDKGHDFGPHLWAGPKPELEEMRETIQKQVAHFVEYYDYKPRVQRGHNLIWVGWTEHAQYLSENEIRMDTNFMATTGFQSGYLNGSGLAVKFMNEKGEMIDVYEQSTIGGDDAWMMDKNFLKEYTLGGAIDYSLELLKDAINKYHTVFHPCLHPIWIDHFPEKKTRAWLKRLCEVIQQRSIKSLSVSKWLDFNDARRQLEIDEEWDEESGVLTLRVRSEIEVQGMTLLLPTKVSGRIYNDSTADDSLRKLTLEYEEQLALVINLKANEINKYTIKYI